jgi:hypothetical protein
MHFTAAVAVAVPARRPDQSGHQAVCAGPSIGEDVTHLGRHELQAGQAAIRAGGRPCPGPSVRDTRPFASPPPGTERNCANQGASRCRPEPHPWSLKRPQARGIIASSRSLIDRSSAPNVVDSTPSFACPGEASGEDAAHRPRSFARWWGGNDSLPRGSGSASPQRASR